MDLAELKQRTKAEKKDETRVLIGPCGIETAYLMDVTLRVIHVLIGPCGIETSEHPV